MCSGVIVPQLGGHPAKSKIGFSTLTLLTFGAIILCHEVVLCTRTFVGIPGLYQLDAKSIQRQTKMSLDMAKCPLGTNSHLC